MIPPSAQKVDVIAKFVGGNAYPVAFKKASRHYPIERIGLVHAERKGREKLTYFSVTDGVNAFRLVFSSESFQWYVEENEYL